MHILVINNAYDAGLPTPDDLLARYHSLTGWAEALVEAGARVSVIQRFHSHATRVKNRVSYSYVKDGFPPRLRARHIPWRLHRMARQLALQAHDSVVHLNGLIFPVQTAFLRASLPLRCPILAQHHAEKPFRGWKKWIQRWGLSVLDGVFFTSQEQAQDWRRAGILQPRQPTFEVMEGSTTFTPGERASARQHTGLQGDPLFLWVGRLDANKDPLTVLAGFEAALPALPGARLAMIYNTETLLPDIMEKLAVSSRLRQATTLVGQAPHDQMETYYRSADYFILGSHYEGSGYALVEAMACGLAPIVTDIPSFRQMTDGGRVGALWPASDAHALAEAIRRATTQPIDPLQVRGYFEQALSYPAIARRAMAAYQVVWEGKCG